jgi:hypothetical protein
MLIVDLLNSTKRYGEYQYPEHALNRYDNCRYAEFHYAECCYAEYSYAECCAESLC